MRIGGLNPREFVHSIFVDDQGQVDVGVGTALLEVSREFGREESEHLLDIGTLEIAHDRAHKEVGIRRDELMVNLNEEIAKSIRSRAGPDQPALR